MPPWSLTCCCHGGLHIAGLVAEDPRSALWEHAVLHHDYRAGDGKEAREMFNMKVTAGYKSSSRRLISEAVQIEQEIQKQDVASRVRGGEERLVLNSIKQ